MRGWKIIGPRSRSKSIGRVHCRSGHGRQCAPQQFLVVRPVPAQMQHQMARDERYIAELHTHHLNGRHLIIDWIGYARVQEAAQRLCIQELPRLSKERVA